MGHVSRLGLAFCASLVLAAGLRAQGRDDFDVGLGLFERGLWEEAARHFESHLGGRSKGNRTSEAWYRLASCRKKLGDKKGARVAFSEVLSLDRKFRYRNETRYQLGRLLQEAGMGAKAVTHFGALLDEAAKDHYLAAPAAYALGECLRDLDKKTTALKAFQRSHQLDSKGERAFASLYQSGFLLLALGKVEVAARTFGQAAKDFPKDSLARECRYLQGRSLAQVGRHADALAVFGPLASAKGEKRPEAALGAATSLIALGRSDEARRQLEKGIVLQMTPPVKGRMCEELAFLLLDAGETEKSARRFEQALACKPLREQAARLQQGLGEALTDARQDEAALEALSKVASLSQDPGLRGDSLYARLHLLHRMGRHEGSLRLCRAFMKEHPEHRSAALARLAEAENLFALKRYAEARKVYVKVEGNDRPKAMHKQAWCLWLNGDKKQAAAAFARLVEDEKLEVGLREDSLAMECLARLELEQWDKAVTRADLYALRYPKGRWLARCERVASRSLEKQGKLGPAARRLTLALSLTKGSGRIDDELGLADMLQVQGDYRAARGHYVRHAENDGPSGFRALEGLTWCAFELGEFDKCRKRGAQALSRPESRKLGAALRHLLCSVELTAKQWAAAERMAIDFLRNHPDNERATEVRFSMALAMARGGKTKEAEKVLEGLLVSGPGKQGDRVWYELAWTRRKLGKEGPALAAFRKVAETSEDPVMRGEARMHLAESLMAAGKTTQAERELAKVEGTYRSRALYQLGFSQFERKLHRPALATFKRLEAMPVADRYSRASSFLAAECHYELGDHQAAATLYRGFLGSQKGSGDARNAQDAVAGHATHVQRARYHLGHCELVLKRPDQSAMQLRQWLGLAGDEANKVDRAQAWLWLGRADVARSRTQTAEKALLEATRLSEGKIAAEAWFRIGELRRGQGKLTPAIEAFLRLSILFDDSDWVSRALLEAGLCFEAQKKDAKAQKLYRELLDRYPGSDSAKSARPRLKTKRKL